LWYTDQYPSLGVAQFPLFQYVRDASHPGKVIFTTSFETSSDPRGALKDFAPIDSVSSASLSTGRLLPSLGDTRVPVSFQLLPDTSDPANLYPPLSFGGTIPLQTNYSVFLRPISRRADAKYIYHIQEDSRSPRRYVYSPVITDLRSVASINSSDWACGVNGVILYSSNGGQSWKPQKSGTSYSLNASDFFTQNSGIIAGDQGTILRTDDAGTTWKNLSQSLSQDVLGVDFILDTLGIAVGTRGDQVKSLIIRTTNGGTSWKSYDSHTNKNLRSVDLYDAKVGVAVGDTGVVIKTADGGLSWTLIQSVTSRQLNSVRFVNNSLVYAVGALGTILRSTDAGDTWVVYGGFTNYELRSIMFTDNTTGWVCGTNGLMYQSNDGGVTWFAQNTGITFSLGNGQAVNDVSFSNASQGWAVCTGGVIIGSNDGGASWSTLPSLPLDVGVIDGVGIDGKRSFVFLGLPMHLLNGDGANMKSFLEKVLLQEFGL